MTDFRWMPAPRRTRAVAMNTDRALMPDEPVEHAPREDLHDPRRGGRELDEANDAHDTHDTHDVHDVHDAQEDPRAVALMAAPMDSSGERVGWAGTALGGAAAALLLVAGAAGSGGGTRDVSRIAGDGEGAVPSPRPQVPSPSPTTPSSTPDTSPRDAEATGSDEPVGAHGSDDPAGTGQPETTPQSDDAPRIALMAAVPSAGGALLTRDATVVVSGIARDAVWEYRLDPGQPWTRGHGDRIAGAVFGADGAKQLEVRQVDLAGTLSPAAGLSFTLDTTAPERPRPRLIHDTGVAGDQITSDWSFSIDALEPDASWRYRIDDGDWRDGVGLRFLALGSDGRALPLADGAHTVRVECRDVVGNRTASQLAFQTDMTAPRDMLEFELRNDTGIVTRDGMTSDPRLAFRLLGPDEHWSVSVDGGKTWLSDTPGASELDLFSRLMPTDGVWEVVARREDRAGNVGPTSAALAVTLDRQGPAAPARIWLLRDTGLDATDGVTEDATIMVARGLESVSAAWRLRPEDAWTPVSANGVIPGTLFSPSATPRTIEVTQWDAAGNPGASAWLTFTRPLALEAPRLDLPGAVPASNGVGLPG